MEIERHKLMAKQIRGAAFDLPPSKSLGALISAFHEGEMIPDYQLEELIKTWERVRASETVEKGTVSYGKGN